MVFNNDGNVFCGQRLDNKAEAWQLPQGGIDEGELPIEAGYRELREETSISNVEFVSEYPEWLNYDIPLPFADNLWEGKYRGQTQRWLLFYFIGIDEGELPIEAGYRELREETSISNVEFVSEYPEWLNYDIPLQLADNLWEGIYKGQTQ